VALLDDIANRLEADGVGGGSDDWAIVKGALMPSPVRQIAIVETGGDVPFNGRADTQGYDYPTFQVFIRAPKYEYAEGRAKAQEAYDSLHLGNLGAAYVDCMATMSAPVFVGFDEDERPGWVQNFRAMKCR
jgi:hypothetical protein